jgi:hypothetical protein
MRDGQRHARLVTPCTPRHPMHDGTTLTGESPAVREGRRSYGYTAV